MSVTELAPSAERAGPKSELERLCQGAMLLFFHASVQTSSLTGKMDARLSPKVPPSAVHAPWAKEKCAQTLVVTRCRDLAPCRRIGATSLLPSEFSNS